jgi:tetratricopeptide (TPR) repeat protein
VGGQATRGAVPPAAISNDPPDVPGPYEVLGALERVIASEELRASPQLVAFLGFVVETARRGDANRIKAYTIAVEALGRGPDFDPETDSIVRVVAGRLRRALEKYYAEAGADDPIVIELPRGSYVPVFRRRVVEQEEASAAVPQGGQMPPATAASQHDPGAGGTRRLVARMQPIRLAALAIAAIGFIALLVSWNRGERDVSASTSASFPLAHPAPALRPAPVVFFQAFDVAGEPPASSVFTADRFLRKLGDAMTHFDGINVVADGGPSASLSDATDWTEYRLGGSVEYHANGTATLSFRLVDAGNGALYWTRSFDGLRVGSDPGAVEDTVIREVASALAGPFGVVWARELNVHSARDPRRACVTDMIEYWRKFNPALHERVRQCSQRMLEADPSDFSGYNGLAMVYLRDFYLDIPRPGEPPALDLALQAALHAIKVKPDSARAYEILFVVWFARGELAQAWATADKAMALSPYDTNIVAEYGARLVAAGQLERGRAVLDASAAENVVRPAGFDFALFLGAYLAGDRSAASRHAAVIENDPSLFGLLARALVGNMEGDHVKASQAIDRLVALNPGWGAEPSRQLAKFFPAAEVRDRLLHDLDAAGLHATD